MSPSKLIELVTWISIHGLPEVCILANINCVKHNCWSAYYVNKQYILPGWHHLPINKLWKNNLENDVQFPWLRFNTPSSAFRSFGTNSKHLCTINPPLWEIEILQPTTRKEGICNREELFFSNLKSALKVDFTVLSPGMDVHSPGISPAVATHIMTWYWMAFQESVPLLLNLSFSCTIFFNRKSTTCLLDNNLLTSPTKVFYQ